MGTLETHLSGVQSDRSRGNAGHLNIFGMD